MRNTAISAVVTLADLQKTYRTKSGENHVLKGIDLVVASGEVVVIYDPMGHDKAALFNVLVCLEPHDSGTYHLFGIDVAQLNERKRAQLFNTRVGVLFSEPLLLSNRTVLDNVALPLFFRALSSRQRKVQALSALRLVDLESIANEPCADYDRKTQQKIALARVLAAEPDLVIVDESSSLFEPETAASIIAILSKQKGLGRTVIVLTQRTEMRDQANVCYHFEDGILKISTEREGSAAGCDSIGSPLHQGPTRQIDVNIYKPVLEAGAQALTIFDGPDTQEIAGEHREFPIDFSIEEALTTDFVKEKWWKR